VTTYREIETEVFDTLDAFTRGVADWLLAQANATQGRFAVALSGGETPRPIYELLASAPYRDKFPWSRTHWFWGDERFVPHDDKRSNYHMTRDVMLSRAPIPAANVHPVPTEGITPEAGAAAYEAELKAFYGADRLDDAKPLFDVQLLGLGPDGHTASLFPGTAVLAERHKWVAPVLDGKLEARITLTYPAVGSAACVAFLVAGAGKREIVGRFLRGDPTLPAVALASVGRMRLFADAATAGTPVKS
jgi:6-phosphogluconolactonase